jgi:PPOX class probable FMN-dependent enzyme
MPFAHVIADLDGLRQHYAEPHPAVQRKQIDHVDAAARELIAVSPFVAVGTIGPHGGDVSPRGGPPGFVAVLDDHRLALGDLAGNRRLDTYENVLADPRVGLLFLVPGMGETLRVNGRACLTTDPEVLEACAFAGTRPHVALGIEVDEVFLHCAKAFRRSRLWDPEAWPTADERPSAGRIFRDHAGIDVPAEVIDADLEAGYVATMWEPGT